MYYKRKIEGRSPVACANYFLHILNVPVALIIRHAMRMRRNIPGYYKRTRHIQCCIETKLLMI